ncbi:MAG: hypothetical protein ACTFAK_06515 [Candidatus Electronema sp. VV]
MTGDGSVPCLRQKLLKATEQDILDICDQLGQKGLLDWNSILNNTLDDEFGRFRAGCGNINAHGIDVKEGNATPAIKVEFVQHNNNTVTITDSTNVNNIIGSNNTLTLSALAKAIESADAPPQEKEEAKTLLRKLSEHPLVSAIIGGAVGLLGS